MKLAAALVPYVAVFLGMNVFRSAWAAILLYHAGILLFLFLRKSSGLWKTVWAGNNALVIPAVVACAMAAPVVYFMWPLFQPVEQVLPEWLAGYGLSGLSFALLVPYFSFIHPVMEEIHWRGLAPKTMKPFCWQDLLFAGYHILVLYELVMWPWLILIFGILTGSSICWRWAANRFDGYLLPVLSHAAADAGVLVGIIFLLRG